MYMYQIHFFIQIIIKSFPINKALSTDESGLYKKKTRMIKIVVACQVDYWTYMYMQTHL